MTLLNQLKKTISSSIKFKRFLNYTYRKAINKKNIWNVYKFKNYDEYINLQKVKSLDSSKRKSWLSDEWDVKLKYFENTIMCVIPAHCAK